MNEQKTKRATKHCEQQLVFWVRPELKKKVQEIAEMEGRSVSNLLNRIVGKYLETYENSDEK